MTAHRRTASLLASLALVAGLAGGLGACSSGGDDADDTSTSQSSETTTTEKSDDGETTTTEETGGETAEEAQARAEAVNITIDDLEGEWTAEATEDSEDSLMDECSGLDMDEAVAAKVRSDDFVQGTAQAQTLISSTTGVFKDEAEAESFVTSMGTDLFTACATESLIETMDPVQVTGGFEPAGTIGGLGEQAVAVSADLTLTTPDGQTQTMSVLMTAIRTGDMVTTLTGAGLGMPLDEELLYPLFDLIKSRQAA